LFSSLIFFSHPFLVRVQADHQHHQLLLLPTPLDQARLKSHTHQAFAKRKSPHDHSTLAGAPSAALTPQSLADDTCQPYNGRETRSQSHLMLLGGYSLRPSTGRLILMRRDRARAARTQSWRTSLDPSLRLMVTDNIPRSTRHLKNLAYTPLQVPYPLQLLGTPHPKEHLPVLGPPVIENSRLDPTLYSRHMCRLIVRELQLARVSLTFLRFQST
jgi:hypothetical protein